MGVVVSAGGRWREFVPACPRARAVLQLHKTRAAAALRSSSSSTSAEDQGHELLQTRVPAPHGPWNGSLAKGEGPGLAQASLLHGQVGCLAEDRHSGDAG